MGFTFVQKKSGTNAGVTLTSSVTSGNLLVVLLSWYASGTVSTVTGGNTYTQATGALAQNGDKNTDIWYVLSAAAGSTTVSATFSAAVAYAIHVYEFSATASVLFDTASNATGTAALTSSISLSVATANEALLSIIDQSGSSTPTVPSTWAATEHTSAAYYDDSSYLADAGGTGSKTANWDLTSTGDYAESMIAFKLSGVGGGGGGKPAYYYGMMGA